MKNKYTAMSLLLVLILAVAFVFTSAYTKNNKANGDYSLKVVTSFYPVYIAALNVTDGAEGISLENLSEPQTGCLHDYQLTPEDMKLLETADVFLINGGGMESFITDVAEKYPNLKVISVTNDIDFIEEGDEINAHVWMDLASYSTEVNNICDIMTGLDSSNADLYKENTDAYQEKIKELILKTNDISDECSASGITVSAVLLQESFEYFAESLGIEVVYTMDLDEERQISAGEVADVIGAVEVGNAAFILTDEQYGAELAKTVSEQTKIPEIVIDPCVRGEYDKDSYIEAMTQNIENVAKVLENR